jgi:AhpD family alkylhydroperoxidase
MDARFHYYRNPLGTKVQKYLGSAGKVVTDSTLPAAVQFLCMIRASQVNGCGFCTDMHTKDAAHAGETSVRLTLTPTTASTSSSSSPRVTTSPASSAAASTNVVAGAKPRVRSA